TDSHSLTSIIKKMQITEVIAYVNIKPYILYLNDRRQEKTIKNNKPVLPLITINRKTNATNKYRRIFLFFN
ncbi:hypothetical protein, partial [Escherichia coli]|uniref:hypothetical protein n=1 Tax=Escherichia coli TaxID=562 RepID=UPI0030C663BD